MNDIFKIDEKWSIVKKDDEYPYITRYEERSHDPDNVHLCMMYELEELRDELEKQRPAIEFYRWMKKYKAGAIGIFWEHYKRELEDYKYEHHRN